jgi:hypothetical protein
MPSELITARFWFRFRAIIRPHCSGSATLTTRQPSARRRIDGEMIWQTPTPLPQSYGLDSWSIRPTLADEATTFTSNQSVTPVEQPPLLLSRPLVRGLRQSPTRWIPNRSRAGILPVRSPAGGPPGPDSLATRDLIESQVIIDPRRKPSFFFPSSWNHERDPVHAVEDFQQATRESDAHHRCGQESRPVAVSVPARMERIRWTQAPVSAGGVRCATRTQAPGSAIPVPAVIRASPDDRLLSLAD